MTKPTVQRIFQVDAPLEQAWHRLAEVERWPEWAPHIISLSVSPPGELVQPLPALKITRLGRNTFRLSAWDPPVRWDGRRPPRGPDCLADHLEGLQDDADAPGLIDAASDDPRPLLGHRLDLDLPVHLDEPVLGDLEAADLGDIADGLVLPVWLQCDTIRGASRRAMGKPRIGARVDPEEHIALLNARNAKARGHQRARRRERAAARGAGPVNDDPMSQSRPSTGRSRSY